MSGVWGKNQFFDPKIITTVTFDNTVNPVTVFTVTGDVVVKIIAVCTTNVASAAAGSVGLGISGTTNAIIATTLGTDLDAREIWNDATPTAEIEALSTAREYIITDGNDIILTPSAQIDSGVLVFYCDWCPLSANGSVV